jgi:hypothetical protein
LEMAEVGLSQPSCRPHWLQHGIALAMIRIRLDFIDMGSF